MQVEHDFARDPKASVQEVMPYELLIDEAGRVGQFRERCYFYLGSAAVYTNIVTTVYDREVKRDHGLNYPESLEEALRAAWKKEQTEKK
jgi:hypothetical protein